MRHRTRFVALGCGAVLVAGLASVAGYAPSLAAATSPPLVRAPRLAAPPAPNGSTKDGTLPSSRQVQIRVVLPPADQSGVQSLLQSLQDPSSPEYHHWLAPGQFVARFGPSPTSVAAVKTWLRGRGLTDVSASGFSVQATAGASTMGSALGTSFERYRSADGHVGYRAAAAPLVPQDLASGQVQAIVGLSTTATFQPALTRSVATRSTSVAPRTSQPSASQAGGSQSGGSPPSASQVGGSQSGGSPPSTTQPAVAQPAADELTACSQAQAEATSTASYTLDQLGADYGIGSLLNAGQNGRGQTVALYELGPSSSSDVSTYKSCFSLTNPVSVVKVDSGGTINANGTLEADVDIEQVATQAPGASIISYEGPNTPTGGYATWETIVDQDRAKVISTSWAECEPNATSDGDLSGFEPLFEQAAAQGQTILAASGDQGSESCYTPKGGSTALEVDYPASSPYVTAVGGTTLYAPGTEVTWNDCEGKTGTSCAAGGGDAGGGGVSAHLVEPSWQPANQYSTTGGADCGDGCREVPDVSANAGVGMVVYDSAEGGWTIVGGTSLAAPLIGGLVADRNDGCTAATGDFAPTLYAAAQGLYGTGLTDITKGDNDLTRTNGGDYPAGIGYDLATGLGSPLAAGLSCPEITGVSPGSGAAGATATVSGLGLEHATVSFGGIQATVQQATTTSATVVVPTGTGTVAVSATSALGTGTAHGSFTYATEPQIATTTTGLAASANPATAKQPVTFTAAVTSSSGNAPTGQVAFVVDGNAKVCGSRTLVATSGGRATAPCQVAFPKAGTNHVLQATYLGTDGFDGSASSKLTEKVAAAPPTTATLGPGKTLTAGKSLSVGGYRLTMQADGNLVEYQGSTARWSSRTAGHPGAGVVMQKNGNFVMYAKGKAIWSTKTAGHPGAHLTLQGTDGNVVVYGPGGRALWATGT